MSMLKQFKDTKGPAVLRGYMLRQVEGVKIPLKEAKLCINCDVIFTGKLCPVCGRKNFAWLSEWIKPIESDIL